MSKLILVDIDGCLSDHSSRIEFARNKQWEEYHKVSVHDPPIEPIVELVKTICGNTKTEAFIFTGRSEAYAEITKRWLDTNSVPRLGTHHRTLGDMRSSADVKCDMLKAVITAGHEVWFAIDDQQEVKEMYEREGVVCLQPKNLLHFVDGSKYIEDNSEGQDVPDGAWNPGWQERNGFSVPSILENAAYTYGEKQAIYKDTYKMHGKVLAQLFPEGISLKTEDDFLRYHLFVLEMVKMIRTARSGLAHIDSQHDLIVYAAMFEESIRSGGNKS